MAHANVISRMGTKGFGGCFSFLLAALVTWAFHDPANAALNYYWFGTITAIGMFAFDLLPNFVVAVLLLMYYIIMMYAAGFVMSLFNPYFYVQYLALDAAAILRGQVWRLVTWVLYPPSTSGVLWFAIAVLFFYYPIGTSLERTIGTFKYTLYILSGVIGVAVLTIVFRLVSLTVKESGAHGNSRAA